MNGKAKISADELVRIATLLAAIRWKAMFASALEHRKVRRGAPEGPGHRFVCTEIDGGHACAGEDVEPGQPVDLLDLVPRNQAPNLESLLATASDRGGALSDEYWALLRGDVEIRGATEVLLARLQEHREREALGAFFVGVELALDALGLPPLQWRNGVDQHGSPRL